MNHGFLINVAGEALVFLALEVGQFKVRGIRAGGPLQMSELSLLSVPLRPNF